jgi:uncharacterized membrane protein
MQPYSESEKPSPAKQAVAAYGARAARACWILLLGGISLSVAIANSYGMEWGHGLTVAYQFCLVTTALSLVCASIAIYLRSNGRDYLAFTLCVLILLFLIILAMNAHR